MSSVNSFPDFDAPSPAKQPGSDAAERSGDVLDFDGTGPDEFADIAGGNAESLLPRFRAEGSGGRRSLFRR